jgi:ATP-binding cassette subfamily F protein 3
MLQIQDLTFGIGDRILLRNVSWKILPGRRTALIGPNGTGKTTLLRIIHGEIPDYQGRIFKPKDFRIGYLPQEPSAEGGGTVLDAVLDGHAEALELERKMESLHRRLVSDAAGHDGLLKELSTAEAQFSALGGYHLEIEAKRVLSGLGFAAAEFGRPLSGFSGGWRMRAYLARLLVQKPDLLLLDEPTNHLDLESLEWLEQHLLRFTGGMVLVSHDRFFIDRLVHEIAELERGRLAQYPGNYHAYETEKAGRIELLEKKAGVQEAEIARQQVFIERFRYKATKARQVQSRIKALDKIERVERPGGPSASISFRLSVDRPSYKDVLKIENLSFRYDDRWILRNVRLNLFRGDRAALVGANGSGKTTLTRLIAGQLVPTEGRLQTGPRTVVGYYAQHQIEALNLDSTVLDEALSTASDAHRPRIRDVLGLFRFSGDDAFKKIRVLSGGEKARVSLAKILVSPVNFLIMDEPTNHLDPASRQALENALLGYDGTLLLISHDRYFLDKLVRRVVEIRNGSFVETEGNYSDYLARREEAGAECPSGSAEPEEKSAASAERDGKKAFKRETGRLKKEIESLEKEIESLERKKAEIEAALAAPETYKDGGRAASIQKDYQSVQSDLKQWIDKWEKAHASLERLEPDTF